MPISSYEEYKAYLAADLASARIRNWTLRDWYSNQPMRFQRLLRRVEYFLNCRRDPLGRLWCALLRHRLHRLRTRFGFTIPQNVFGPGLSIAHCGTIVVNAKTRVGRNCRIHVCVNIGEYEGRAPIIGDNVYIAPGAKIFGGITIGDNAVIAANAVVRADVPPNVTVGGVPARIISSKDSSRLVVKGAAVDDA